jgi:predicted permease
MSLALGIGANTAMFQLLNALTLRTLPVPAPHELVEIRLTGDGRDGRHTGRNRQVSLPQFRAIASRQEAFTSLMAFGDTRFNLAPAGEVRYVDGLWVSGDFFGTLGVTPLIGRLLGPADYRQECGTSAPAAVISYPLWQTEFGGRPDILTQTVPFGAIRVPIVGVTQPLFYGVEVGRQFSVALPICMAGFERKDHWWLASIGRLKPGWSRAAATAQLSRVFREVQEETLPDYRPDLAAEYLAMGITVEDASSGVSPLRRLYREPLWILMAISGMVLLMAAVNLGNLLLARATARQSEFAVRLALGGGPRRILQQVLVESALLAALGAVAALAVAWVISRSIPPLISTAVDRIHLDLGLDWRVYGFTTMVAAAATLIFGGAPALRAARTRILSGMTRGGASNEGLRFRRALVALQIAVTLVLLFGGTLFLRTFNNLASVDSGVNERGIVVPVVFFNERTYPVERRRDAYRQLDERIRSLPGVISATDAYTTPMGGSIWDTDIESDEQKTGSTNGNRIGPGYFATLGTRFIAGRDFDARDVPGSPRVAIVNESFAKAFYTGDPIGRRFRIPSDSGGAGITYDIIGLVADQKYTDLREAQTRILFLASDQEPELPLTRRYVIRAAVPASDTVAAVTAALAEFDPRLAVRYDILDTQIGQGMLRERLMARLSMIFGGVALLLAVVGLYGVVSYGVASRRAEIGVRVALGASRHRILAMVLGDVGRLMTAGVLVGSVLALAAGRGIRTLLFGVEGTDAFTLVTAAGVLVICGFASAAWPARRAAGIDPVSALRES